MYLWYTSHRVGIYCKIYIESYELCSVEFQDCNSWSYMYCIGYSETDLLCSVSFMTVKVKFVYDA
jgi:hypothetical protein